MNSARRTTAACLAPAKLNTSLAVLGRRDDGYHELDTTMVAVAPCDVVTVTASDAAADVAADVDGEAGSVALAVLGPAADADVRAAGADNAAVRAARDALAAVAALDHRARDVALAVRLVKHVPARAGLGGGSADAAAALLAVREVLGTRLGRSLTELDWIELAARHGSDTAFFTAARFGGRARATGRGERVEPLAGERAWFALVVPDVGCSTPAVYGAFAEGQRAARPGAPRRNDLECAARAVEPQLGAWFEALGPSFGLSGSGSALFAQAPTRAAARARLAGALEAAAGLGRAPRLAAVTRALGHGVRPLFVPPARPLGPGAR